MKTTYKHIEKRDNNNKKIKTIYQHIKERENNRNNNNKTTYQRSIIAHFPN